MWSQIGCKANGKEQLLQQSQTDIKWYLYQHQIISYNDISEVASVIPPEGNTSLPLTLRLITISDPFVCSPL